MGAIAGILIAVFAVWKLSLASTIWLNDTLGAGLDLSKAEKGLGVADVFAGWAKNHNPFHTGAYSDILGFLPILVLAIILYMVGRELWLAGKDKAA